MSQAEGASRAGNSSRGWLEWRPGIRKRSLLRAVAGGGLGSDRGESIHNVNRFRYSLPRFRAAGQSPAAPQWIKNCGQIALPAMLLRTDAREIRNRRVDR